MVVHMTIYIIWPYMGIYDHIYRCRPWQSRAMAKRAGQIRAAQVKAEQALAMHHPFLQRGPVFPVDSNVVYLTKRIFFVFFAKL